MTDTTYNYFIKGDISGIQDFIFNVKSEKAARVLKARSVFVEVLSAFAKGYVISKLGVNNSEIFYDGGGSFFLYIKDDRTVIELTNRLKDFEIAINSKIHREDIYIVFSITAIADKKKFQSYWDDIAIASNKDKLRKYLLAREAFEPYSYGEEETEEEAEEQLLAELDLEKYEAREIARRSFQYLKEQIGESDIRYENAYQSGVQSNFPIWRQSLYDRYEQEIKEELRRRRERNPTEKKEKITADRSIIDYHFLAHFAQERTGTRRIGILKMDIDDLGNLFSHAPSDEIAKKVSQLISNFLSIEINSLLQQPFLSNASEDQAYTFQDNIYTIFSGGDDCFFVGAWDAILEWAARLQAAFHKVAEEIKIVLEKSPLPLDDVLTLPPTISAGIVLVEPTHPVVRFARLAEDALDEAKYSERYNFKKNKIALFEEVLSWEEYEKVRENAVLLASLVKEKNEPKSTLDKIRQSAEKFQKMQSNALQNNYTNLAVGKLFYMIRNAENEKILSKEIINPYAKDLIAAFTTSTYTNPMKYPIAARWAELLTRKPTL